MDRGFHEENRKELYRSLEEGTLFVCFAGRVLPQSADAEYPFFANRNFVYLTGLDGAEVHDFIFLAKKTGTGVEETIFALPPDPMAARPAFRHEVRRQGEDSFLHAGLRLLC